MGDLIEIPARGGKAARLKKGQALKMINTHGHQVVDTWAFNADDLNEFMSMEHLRAMLGTIFPKQGDSLYTNQRRPILVMEEDTSPGIHDTLMAACDVHRYRLLGCTDYHENCTDNLAICMKELGLTAPETPSPPSNLHDHKPRLHTRGISPAKSCDLEVTRWAPTRLTSCISHPGPEESSGASTLGQTAQARP